MIHNLYRIILYVIGLVALPTQILYSVEWELKIQNQGKDSFFWKPVYEL